MRLCCSVCALVMLVDGLVIILYSCQGHLLSCWSMLPCFLYVCNVKLLRLYLTTTSCYFYVIASPLSDYSLSCLLKKSNIPSTLQSPRISSPPPWNSMATTISSELSLFITLLVCRRSWSILWRILLPRILQLMMIGWLVISAWWLDSAIVWIRRPALESCF